MPRIAALAVAMLVFAFVASTPGCGSSGGTKAALPPGPQTSAPPSDQVIYASLAHEDKVVAYRLGTDGFLPGEPFDWMEIDEPRQVLVEGNVLYVAQADGVSSIRINDDGSLPASPTAITARINKSDASQMIVNGSMLYVSMENIDRVLSYRLAQGQVSAQPVTVSGGSSTNYIPIELGNNGFLYAGTRNQARIDTYAVFRGGLLSEDPELQDPEARIFDCKDLLHHDGILYAIEQDDRRIVTFTILPSGLLPNKPDSKTAGGQAYAYLALDGDDRLYASAFNEGRIDLYIIPPGGLFDKKQKSYAHTWSDTGSFPTQMLIQNGLLYVAQAGIGRIDAYILGGDGAPSEFPATSTFTIADSYLNSITIGTFPP